VDQTGENRNAYRDLMGTPEGKRALEKTTSRWEDSKCTLNK
jgi:hypothetical protein